MLKNPDPSKYVIRVRRGKAILVDKQILRWRKGFKGRKPIGKALFTGEKVKKPKETPKGDIVDRIKKLF